MLSAIPALLFSSLALAIDAPERASTRALHGEAMDLMRADDAESARVALEAALAELEANATDDPDLIPVLDLLAQNMKRLGHYAEALEMFERAIALARSVHGEVHEDVAELLNNIGTTQWEMGQVEGARASYRNCLKISVDLLGPDHLDVATTMENLAILEGTSGDLVGSRALLERVLAIQRAQLPEDHPDILHTLSGLAWVSNNIGDRQTALDVLQGILEVERATNGPDSRQATNTEHNIGVLYALSRRTEEALVLQLHVLEVRERHLAPDHPSIATALNAVAGSYNDLGDHTRAQPILERALAIREGRLGPEHQRLIPTLTALSEVLVALDDPEAAIPLMQRAMDISQRVRGDQHPNTAWTLFSLAEVLHASGRHKEARKALRDAVTHSSHVTAQILPGLSEREGILAVKKNRYILHKAVSALEEPEDAAEVYAMVLRWKGSVARALARTRAALQGSEDVEVEALAAELEEIRNDVAKFAYRAPDPEALDALQVRRDAVERQLGHLSGAWRSEFESRDADLAAVCRSMPRDGVVVDLLRHQRANRWEYVAFLVDPRACTVRRVNLGNADAIDAAAASWRDALSYLDDDGVPMLTRRVDDRGAALHELVWEPIEPFLRTELVLVVPDGPLAAVPFHALPTNERYVIEDHTVAYLESATDVIRWDSEAPGQSGALFIGNIEFGGAQSEEPTRSSPCLDSEFGSLPGTGEEVDAIHNLWKRYRKKETVTLLSGEAPREDVVVEALTGNRVVHLATHGYFASDDCRSALTSDDGDSLTGHHPMTLSGLALAGANNPYDPLATDDGILTADEVASLDLGGTELVVLSGCETARGHLQPGQGVAGLRRAFAAAGARTLVMSLWAVSDEETVALMEDLYRGALHPKRPLPTAEALRQAQLARLHANRRTLGEGRPQDWGAFIAAGDSFTVGAQKRQVRRP